MLRMIVAVFSCALLLGGCADEPYNVKRHPDQYVVFQNVPDNRAAMRIQPMVDHTNIILTTDQIFKPRSSVFRPNAVSYLNQLVSYLNTFDSYRRITVDAYYSEAGGGLKKLTHRQAENIAAFLWTHGFSKHHIIFHGHGDSHPVAVNFLPSGTAANRRIEINVY